MTDSKILIWAMVLLCIGACTSVTSQQADNFTVPYTPSDNWERDFMNPPAYAHARAWWWWLEGYMTRQGVLDDLSAMKEAGIAGASVFDAGSSGYYTGGEISYHSSVLRTQSGPGFMSDEWRELFAYSCRVADSLGIELSLNITSGWNDGGPWVTPEYASQKLVWSEILVEGGRTIEQPLPLPERLLTCKDMEKAYFQPIAVLALKLSGEAESVKPLPWFDIKAVHTINIPYTSNGLGYDWDVFVQPLPEGLSGCHARLEDIIDISDKVDADGNIKWNAPAGRYAIMRFGHTGTGVQVSTHSPGAGGLAIDYMNDKALDLQFEHVVYPVLQDLQQLGTKSLLYLLDDSWELGAANWTPGMEQAFAGTNGYEIRKYLPVIAGKIIENHDVSDRFLYDFRRTIGDLIWKNHYQRLRDLAHQHGMGIHPESGGPHPAPIDALKNMGANDVPMGEFWAITNTHRVEPHRRLYIKQGASAAHIYGKRFMQAEGPTTIGPHWERDPWLLKPTFDRVFCEGLTRFNISTFTHSPREAGIPGNEYFAGTHFNPNITWWKQEKTFLDWVARNSFLLSQGLFTADVAFYYGDNVPNQAPLKHIDPRLGNGYDYDVVNTDVILNRMTARDGKIYLPDGMNYSVLVLPDRKTIKTEVLEKIEQLVKDGATVIGPKPETTVGLRDGKKAKEKVNKIAARLWKGIEERGITENNYGKGKVVWGKDIRTVLQEKGILPDFEYRSNRPADSTLIDYIHRSEGVVQVYYVANRKKHAEWLNCSFRTDDLQPELWYPETGKIVPVSIFRHQENQTSLPLYLDPYGSVFVVFRSPSTKNQITSLVKDGIELFPEPAVVFDRSPITYSSAGKVIFNQSGEYTLVREGKTLKTNITLPDERTVGGVWKVAFDPKWGGPAETEFKQLVSWSEHPDKGIKYYSGTAVYKNTLTINETDLQYRIMLHLGELHNLCEVSINGQLAEVWWKEPFSGDITDYLHAGENTLEIKVVNLWPNRLIGDQFLPEDKRFTKTNVVKFTKESPLLPSGLLGPVSLSFSSEK
ncbi:MAG: glycoside hydrolase family 2 [Tannerella sp.]|jgi:hypothetical protein|nr:glycoside hydrolase family 2 [Tannerella sp.]